MSQIDDPSGRITRFHDDQVDLALVLFEDRSEVVSIGRGSEKGMFTSFGIIKAALGIEFAEVNSEKC